MERSKREIVSLLVRYQRSGRRLADLLILKEGGLRCRRLSPVGRRLSTCQLSLVEAIGSGVKVSGPTKLTAKWPTHPERPGSL